MTITTFGNGLRISLRVARQLERIHITTHVVDLRWLAPLTVHDMLREATATVKALIVDDTRESGGMGESVLATLSARGFSGGVDRIASKDNFIPLGDAAL